MAGSGTNVTKMEIKNSQVGLYVLSIRDRNQSRSGLNLLRANEYLWRHEFLSFLCIFPPSYFLSKEDILIKFCETTENISVHDGFIFLSLYFYVNDYFYTFFIRLYLKIECAFVIFFESCKMCMKNCFKAAFLIKIQTSMDQNDVH